jgi:adenosylcobinamide-GDP ribazoletransferase
MRERSRPTRAALSFLTTLPIGRTAISERDLRRGAVLFPMVGAAVGALVACVGWVAGLGVPPFAAAVIGVAAGVGITGALHVDGLGDVADGVGASLTGRQPAEVMRDPRLGTFGIAAVTLDLVLKASLISELVARGFPWAVVASGSLARVAPIALAWRLPYVGGGGGRWTEGIGPGTTFAALSIALAIAVPTGGLATAWMTLAVVAAAVPVAWWSARRLGGITGDGFGAAAELGETLALVAAVALR